MLLAALILALIGLIATIVAAIPRFNLNQWIYFAVILDSIAIILIALANGAYK
jgi:hypothetical protein